MTKLSMPTTRVKFGDVAINSTTVSADPEAEGFDRYIIGKHIPEDADRIETWGPVGDSDFGPRIRTIFQPGDVICTTRGPKLKVARVDFKGLGAHTNFYLRTADPEVLLQPYLEAVVRSNGFQQHLVNNFRGSVNLFVNWSDAAKYEFALPPLEEQRRIAELLQAMELAVRKIDKSRRAVSELWRSASADEFGPKANKGVSLMEYCSIVNGQVDPKLPEYAEMPLIAPNHIEPGKGVILQTITAREQGAISGKYQYRAGAVLYSKIRPELRKAAIAISPGLCSADMYALTPSPELLNEYLLEILLSDSFTRFAISGSTRTGMPKVNRKHMAKFHFNLPSFSEQEEYLRVSRALHAADRELRLRRNNLTRLRSNLISQVMTK
jgi:type I restriction enzyme S subunit